MTTAQWLDDVAKSALSSRVTLQASYDAAAAVIRAGIPGDFVECGVWAGANSAAMARAIMKEYGPTRPRVHLFDSFEGIPAGGEHDGEWIHPAGTSACSIEVTKQQMNAWGIPEELLVYHPGWFADAVPAFAMVSTTYNHKIALLRLDGDLYESTKVCLEHLYPLVSPGGIVIIDDYVLPGCRKAVHDYGLPNGPIYFHKGA